MAAPLLLLRHGRSTWNDVGRWHGRADPPLSQAGRREVVAVVPHLPPVACVVSSTQVRAAETAELLVAGLGLGEFRQDARLVERDLGPWEGLTTAQIDAGQPANRAGGRLPPGAEGDQELLARVLPALHEIADRSGPALVVIHSGVLYALEARSGIPTPWRAPLGHLEGRWISLVSGLELGPRLSIGELCAGVPKLASVRDPDPTG